MGEKLIRDKVHTTFGQRLDDPAYRVAEVSEMFGSSWKSYARKRKNLPNRGIPKSSLTCSRWR